MVVSLAVPCCSPLNCSSVLANGITALMAASQNGYVEVVKELLNSGADINAKDNDGCTALMLASENGHLEVVNELLNRGADIRARDNHGKTVLTHACFLRESARPLIMTLLAHGAAPKEGDDSNFYSELASALYAANLLLTYKS